MLCMWLLSSSALLWLADWERVTDCWNAILCLKQWQAVVFPLTLTSLMYAGTFILKVLLLLDSGQEDGGNGRSLSLDSIKNVVHEFIESVSSMASDISAWRNFIVVSNLTRILSWLPSLFTLLSDLCIMIKIYLNPSISWLRDQ